MLLAAQGEALDQKLRLPLAEALARRLTLHQLADRKVIAPDTELGHVRVILMLVGAVGDAS